MARGLRNWSSIERRGRGIHAALADRTLYERQIDRLHQRHMFDGGLHRLSDGDVNLATIVMHRAEVARLLVRTVSSGKFRLRPATVRTIVVGGKRRVVFSYPLLDLIVGGAVAEVLSRAVEPTLSDNLHSYRPGRSWMDGVSALARYVRRHRRQRPDPRTRGVYVLRRDVESYTDTIPLGAGSAIWALLDEAIAMLGEPLPTDEERSLIEDIVRPTVYADDGATATRLRGVATGQPIASLCFNLFLRDIDRAIDSIPGAFYARYSDDLVFAHPDPEVVRAASDLLDRRIADLGLSLATEKRLDVYLTGAGRASAEWPAAEGTTSVTFLGMRVSADGTVALGRNKLRRLLRDARRRAANTAQALADADEEQRGRAVARVLTTLLDGRDPRLGGAAAPLLAQAVTDRAQLDELDYVLARITAAAATSTPGPAAFRRVPYSRIRGEWGLHSLRRARDNGQAKGRATRSGS